MITRKIAILAGAAATVWLVALPAQAEDNGLHRGDVYSTAAVNRFCKEAQQIIGGTSAESINIIWDNDAGFIGSDAAPYADAGASLPLTTQQFVSYGVYPDSGDKQYPLVISCKMKRWDDIIKFVDPNAIPGATCQDVIADTAQRVEASLTNREVDFVIDADLEVELESDDVQRSGFAWTTPLPPTLACTDVDGILHIQGKSLPVPNFFYPWPLPSPAPPGWGPEKTGVHYCHLPAAEYLRELLTGNLQAPACD
jgi:hypothetical protein